MDDATLAATCIADEAGNQPYEGKVAVGLVIRRRMTARFESDGTVAGTVLAPMQFSGFWCDMVDGQYKRTVWTLEEAAERAVEKAARYQATATLWFSCVNAWNASLAGSGYSGGPQWDKLNAEPRALLYCNPRISSPPWATPDKLVAEIYDHSFFRT